MVFTGFGKFLIAWLRDPGGSQFFYIIEISPNPVVCQPMGNLHDVEGADGHGPHGSLKNSELCPAPFPLEHMYVYRERQK